MNRKELTQGDVTSLLWRYSLPAITGMLVQSLYNIIDRMFVAHIPKTGTEALAAVGVAFPVMTFILAVGLWLGVGGRVQLSMLLGQNKKREAEQLMATLVKRTFVISLIIAIVGLIFLRPLLRLCGASSLIMPDAVAYLRLILIATPINLIGFVLAKWISTDGQPKRTLLLQVLSTLLNIILAPLLIFVCHFGIHGAALATIGAQTFLLGGALYYFYVSPKRTMTLDLKEKTTDQKALQRVMATGFPSFMMQLLASLVQLLCNVALQKIDGHLSVGAMAIVQSVSLLLTQPIFGLTQGLQPLVSYNYGANQPQRIRAFVKKSLQWTLWWTAFGFIVVEVFPNIITAFFTSNHTIQQLATYGLRLFLVAIMADGVQIIMTSYFQAVGNSKVSSWLSVLRQGVLFIPLIMVLPALFGVTGVFMTGMIADIIAFIITIVYVYKTQSSDANKKKTG